MSQKKIPGTTKAQVRLDALAIQLLDWFSTNARDLPWRHTHDPYAIWVSEIMLQQTQVKTVIPYWERWMKTLPTIADLAAADPALIHKLWEGLGYYTRVRNLQKGAQAVMTQHAGKFPAAHELILELPGIGRYTAGAIASIAFNDPYPILDGNVIRVLTRVFGINANPREKSVNEELWRLADQLVKQAATISTDQSVSHFNQSLMELGALICTPKQPKCLLCPIRKNCIAFKTGQTETLPNLGPRMVTTNREFTAYVLENKNKFLAQQRPAGVVNGQLWEFPNWEADADGKLLWPATVQTILEADPGTEICVLKHAITRYRITLRAVRRTISEAEKKKLNLLLPKAVWRESDDLKALAFTSAHRKILGQL